MNPAVTLAFAVVQRLPWIKVPVYWAAQMLGAFVASACCYGVYYGTVFLYFMFLIVTKITFFDRDQFSLPFAACTYPHFEIYFVLYERFNDNLNT